MVSFQWLISALCLYSLLALATADCASDLEKEIHKKIPAACKHQTGDEIVGCAKNSGLKIDKIPTSCTQFVSPPSMLGGIH